MEKLSAEELNKFREEYIKNTINLINIQAGNFLHIQSYVKDGIGIIPFNNIFQLPEVIEYKKEINQMPAVIIGCGPSLDKHLTLLKENKNNLFIIAVDAAVPILYKHDIIPNLITICDHNEQQAKNFQHYNINKPIVCAASVINPMAFHSMRQADCRIAWYHMYGRDYLSQSIARCARNKGTLFPAVLTSGMAYQIAIWFGIKKIAFIGNDLFYPSIEQGYASDINEDKKQFQFNIKMTKGDLLFFPDINNKPVLTHKTFVAFHSWMNIDDEQWLWPGVKTYNCSECGILYGNRIIQETFKNFINQHSIEKIGDIAMDILNEKYNIAIRSFDKIIGEVK